MEHKNAAKKPKRKSYKKLEPIINTLADIDFSGRYSYASYLRWMFDERLELIRGKVFEMAAPTTLHQHISMIVSVQLYLFLEQKNCKVFAAPFDVRLIGKSKKNEDILSVVQPDLCVICDPHKIDKSGCLGAPDIIIEILSKGKNTKELKVKYDLYQEHGVREYWIIDPQKCMLVKHVLCDGIFAAGKYFGDDAVFESDILPGFMLKVNEIF